MDILEITHCHYDGILAIYLHSFSVKACVHLSTNFTSLNILGGEGGVCKPYHFGLKMCIPGIRNGFRGNYGSV